MAKSAFVEVNITNPTRLAQDSQDTANNAVKGVTDLNDPNLMSVIEKQNNIGQFAGLTSQYNVLVQNAKDDGIDTTAVTTAYNNLNRFMADILADPDHASDVDRVTYKKYQDAYNQELVNLQSALQNNTNNKFTSAASATSQAASVASQAFSAANGAFSQAKLIGSQADSAIAVQSQATAKAQSTADNAFKQAQVIGSQASAEIATQSEATIKAQSTADSAFSEAQKVGEQTSAEIAKQSEAITGAQSKANSALAKAEEVDGKTSAEIAKQSAATAKAQSTADSAFKEAQSATAYTDKQIASQASAVSEVSKTATEASSKANSALDTANSANAEIVKLKGGSTATIAKLEDGLGTKVSNDTFDSYQTQTASQFAQTVKEADFKTYQTQTSKLIESKVDNGTYQTDKTQTAGAIASKVSSGEFKTYQTQTDKALSSKVSSSDYESDREQTASQIADKVSNGEFSTYKTQTDKLIGSKVDNGDFKTYQTQTDKLIESKVDNGTYQSDKTQTANQIASKVSSSDFNSYKSQTDKEIGSKVDNGIYQSDKTQTAKEIADKVSSGDFSTYKTQTDKLIASKVNNGDFETYKTQTAGLISQKVAAKDFQAYQATTAKSIESKVESNDFNTYKSQTDKAISSKVSTTDFNNLTISNRNLALGTATPITFIGENKPNQSKVGYQFSSVIPKGTVVTVTFDIASSTGVGTYAVSFYGKDSGSSWENFCRGNLVNGTKHVSVTFTTDSSHLHIWPGLYNATGTITISNFIVSESSKEVSWTPAPEDQASQSKITQLSGQIDQKVDSGDFSTYKTQTTGLIAEKVANKDFATYQKQTADLISAKVETKDFSSYKDETAKSIDSMVKSKDFESYKTQTAGMIDSKVSNSNYTSDMKQMAGQIDQKVSSGDFNSYKTQTDKLIAEKVSNGDFTTYKSQTANLISARVATKDFKAYQDTTAKAISNKVESNDFNSYKIQTANQITSTVGQISGVNLIPNSDFSQGNQYWHLSDNASIHAHGWKYTDGVIVLDPSDTTKDTVIDIAVSPNTDYTFSCNMYGSLHVFLVPMKDTTAAWIPVDDDYQDNFHNLTGTDENTPRQSFTLKRTSGQTRRLRLILRAEAGTTRSVFTKLQLEEGKVAHAWGPSTNGLATFSQITQLKDDIDLRVKKGDLLDQINIQAGNTLISSSGQLTLSGKSVFLDSANPVIMKSANIDKLLVGKKLTAADISANTFTTNNGTFTVEQDGSVTAKNMTLKGGTLTSPTINASKINSATINGTTINAGDIINSANNTSHFYPTTISDNGHIYTVQFNSSDAMQTDLSTGSLTTKYRAVNSAGTQYEAYDTLIQANQIALFAGHTNGKDMSFAQSVTGSNQDGYVLISPLDGITLHGDHQWLRFNGYASDTNPSGIVMTPWGNINPQGNQSDWYVGNKNTDKTAQFGIDSGHQVTINLFRATFVDEIGAMGNRLDNGRLLLHAVDGNAQMYLLNDGSPAVASPTVYNRTYSDGANVYVTSYGRIGRSTSASKYKLAIARSDDTLQADRLMTLKPASWNDKVATEKMAESLSNGEIPVEEEINLRRHYGLIAEDLRDAGLDEFLITGKDGQIEGIEYDRLWTVLIPKIKQLNNRINELERKTL